MFVNYFIVAFRNIRRQKIYSVINISGLAVAMACCILIMLWVTDELSYDNYHENLDRIYRVVQDNSEVTSPPFADALKKGIPEVIDATRFFYLSSRMIKYDSKVYSNDKFALADPGILNIFSLPLVKGDIASALDDPHSILLTEETCKKYFGDEEPIGKTIKIDNRFDFHVTGVLKDIPQPSYFNFDILANFEFLRELWNRNLEDWEDFSFENYVLTQDDIDLVGINKKINSIYDSHVSDNKRSLHLQPLHDMYLYKVNGEGGPITHVYVFSLIALIVIIVACFNFINLTTARGIKRAKEIGIRIAIGAYRKSILGQFLFESVFLAIIAGLIAILCVEIILPTFNSIIDKNLVLVSTNNVIIWAWITGIILLTGLLAGISPAIYFATIKPANALKNKLLKGDNRYVSFRRVLVVLQLSISVILILFTLAIQLQMKYMKSADLGYSKDNIIYLKTTIDEIITIAPAFEELSQYPGIVSGSISGNLPGRLESSSFKVNWDGKDPDTKINMEIIYADYDFLQTFGLSMAEGRFYSHDFSSDMKSGFVVNEAAIKAMGLDNKSAIGVRFSLYDKKGSIIGVVKDFHSRSLHYKIDPLIIHLSPYANDHLSFRLRPENVSETINYMASVWKKYAPDYPFDYLLFNETIDNLYGKEQKMGRIFSFFAFLAVLISCLGLFGLASFMAEQRTKETAVRKVFGATIFNLIILISKEFIILTVLACLMAWPIAYYTINSWLLNFAYRTQIGWEIFITSGSLVLLIAIAAVSGQAIKSARTNPIESLKYE